MTAAAGRALASYLRAATSKLQWKAKMATLMFRPGGDLGNFGSMGTSQPRWTALAALLLGLTAWAATASARPVDLQLVLAIDVSSSIDRHEYLLQVQGLATAFQSAEVGEAIDRFAPRGIAVTVLQWASENVQRQVVAWIWLRDEASRMIFARRLAAMRRIDHEGVTAIALAIRSAHGLFRSNGFEGGRLVIDVSGDGTSNQGPAIGPERRLAVAAGITINGLAILNEQPYLDVFYRRNVIGGPGAFVMTATDYTDFAKAIRAKLVREVSGGGLVKAGAPVNLWTAAAISRKPRPLQMPECRSAKPRPPSASPTSPMMTSWPPCGVPTVLTR